MIWLGTIAAITTFLFFKNKRDNRAIDCRNKLIDKHNELIESLKENTKENES